MARYFLITEEEYLQRYSDVPRARLPRFSNYMASLCNAVPYALSNDGACGLSVRERWANIAYSLSLPVAEHFASGNLSVELPLFSAPGKEEYARTIAPLEALARCFCGVAPWLELDEGVPKNEESLKEELCKLLIAGFERSVEDRVTSSVVVFDRWNQCLVEGAYLCQALLAARRSIFDKLSNKAKNWLKDGLLKTRGLRPFENNWLLFPAIIEMVLQVLFDEGNFAPIEYAVARLSEWYVGDGLYKDGKDFALDYYNSFVIHPMLMDIFTYLPTAFPGRSLAISRMQHEERMLRYMELLERMILREGQMPLIGRSQCYRTGRLYALAKGSLHHLLPSTLKPSALRAALDAAIRYDLEYGENVDSHGWLQPGIRGSQVDLCEDYITTGSLYMATLALQPLGLPIRDPFWSSADAPSTATAVHEDIVDRLVKDISLERGKEIGRR